MAGMKALRIYAGHGAMRHLRTQGLQAADVGVVAGAAGGPKGLILGHLDRLIFGHWLASSTHTVHLVGASIGAWRMATACLDDAPTAFARFEHDYVHQHYPLQPGQRRWSAEAVSAQFRQGLQAFFAEHVSQLLHHPRFRLHVVTSRGRGLLRREGPWATAAGYGLATMANLVARRALGQMLERVVFSAPETGAAPTPAGPLPFDATDFATRQAALSERNVLDVLQASCSIPFVLRAVHDIEGAPTGAYWDGGVTDYHLHLNYAARARQTGLVLYPHFQKAVVPGWLDKGLPWRHKASAFLDSTVVLAPDPEWVRGLPGGKLPDRTDFSHFGNDLRGRVSAWRGAIAASEQLADELAQWLDRAGQGDCRDVEIL